MRTFLVSVIVWTGCSHPPSPGPATPTQPQPAARKEPPSTERDASATTPPPDHTAALAHPPGAEPRGIADAPRRDPYVQRLAADVHEHLTVPARTTGRATGCVHIVAEGRIAAIKVMPSGDATLDEAVHTALVAAQRQRDAAPEPVPAALVKTVTTTWICFALDAAAD